MTYKRVALILLIFLIVSLSWHPALAESPQEVLDQYISALQKNPNDTSLREKIIKHVQAMTPAPVIAEEAKKHMTRGKEAFKAAKEANDFIEVVDEFSKALLFAPWVGIGYFNLGIAQDKAGQHSSAVQSLKLYLMASPNALDAEKVKGLIYEIEYRQEKAQKESAAKAAIAERERQKKEVLDRFMRMVQGSSYEESFCSGYEGKCNESEKSGSNWLKINKLNKMAGMPAEYYTFSVTPDGKIKFRICIVTLEGPNILWTDNNRNSIWIDHNSDWSSFTISYDRPVDDVGYDPNRRYGYWLYERR